VLLFGKNPVLERIKAAPSSIRKLYLQKRTDLSVIVQEAKKQGLDFVSVEKDMITKLAGDSHTQGVVAEIDDFMYTPFSDILSAAIKNKTVIIFLDGITDPQNLGSIIRTLACFGGFSLVIPEFDSASVNETVLRVASGGENFVKIACVSNIATVLKKVRVEGINISGAVAGDGVPIYGVDFHLPSAVVIGSEGKGIRPGVLKELDIKFSVPMSGGQLSFNASVSAAIIAAEISRRKYEQQK